MGLKHNGIHQFLVYTDNVNLLGEYKHYKEKQKTSLAASQGTGLGVNIEKTKYTFMAHGSSTECRTKSQHTGN
jgi:hypothetical protein